MGTFPSREKKGGFVYTTNGKRQFWSPTVDRIEGPPVKEYTKDDICQRCAMVGKVVERPCPDHG